MSADGLFVLLSLLKSGGRDRKVNPDLYISTKIKSFITDEAWWWGQAHMKS